MQASISNFRNMEVENKMLILGDMRELGKDGPKEHQKIADFLAECGFKDVMLVGEQFAAASITSRLTRMPRQSSKFYRKANLMEKRS